MMFSRWFLAVALGMVLSFTISGVQPAQGYLLPPQQLMEFVARQTARVYNFRLEAVAERPDPSNPAQTMKREMVVYAARPDFLRQEIMDTAGGAIILVGSGRRLSVISDLLFEEVARHEEIFPVLLFANSAETLETLLTAEDVDINQVHLSRMGRQIAYVIGGPPRETESPQFWCNKDHFWPVRLVGHRTRDGMTDLVDIRFLSYKEVAKDIWMPSVIEFYRYNQLFLRLTVKRTQINERLPDSLFNLEAFAAKYPPLPMPKEPSEKPVEPLEEMRRYLEKKYE